MSVLVREPGEGGMVIPGAQVLDKSTGELLGLTFLNGKMTFTVPLGSRSVSVIVLAANYLPRERTIQLRPTNAPIDVTVALLRRNPISVTPGDSGYTFRLGDYVYISIHPGGFTRNGTVYNDVVMFDGVFMDPDDEGFFDMIDGDQFIIDDSFFALFFMTYTYFSDPDGNELIAEVVDYYIKVDNPEQLEQDSFLATYDQETQEWVSLGTLSVTNSLIEKRQNAIFLVQLDTALAQFIFHATITNISCWLQVRSFDNFGEPAQGLVAIVRQVGTRPDGMRFSYVFGTNTGAAQLIVDNLEENAVCLPLACDGFERATVEGNFDVDATGPLTPLDFPPNTFGASEMGAPTRLGRVFIFEQVVTSTPSQPRPFFDSLDSCVSAAQVNARDADERNFFSFEITSLRRVPNDSNCFVKIRITECLRNDPNQLILVDSSGIQNGIVVEFEDLIDEMFSADHFLSNYCIEAARIACVPFNCNTQIQITVRDDFPLRFCNVERISPIINNPLLLGSSSSAQSVVIRAQELAEQDYNNPDLGLYFDPSETAALQICRDPLDPSGNPVNNAAMAGYAASFDCILE